MAELISNSGTTFIAAGGTVGVQVSTNTNWRFYLTGRTGVPDWLHFNGNVSEITGSESKMVTVEATKNTQTTTRSASGICQSISEPTLTAWTGFWQGAGGGSDTDTVELNIILRVIASTSNTKLTSFFINLPEPNRIFTWNASSSDMSGGIPVSTNGTVIQFNHLPLTYRNSLVINVSTNRYEVSMFPTGTGEYVKVNTGTQRVGINANGRGTGRNYNVEGSGIITIDTFDIIGGYYEI